jgi:SAM-dependent methyltransferase
VPACVDCVKFDPAGPRCTVEDGSPIRKCVIASLEQHLSGLRRVRVCEIGCGAWPYAKNIVEANGCEWFGIDPKAYDSKGRKTIRTHAGTVASLPFSDQYMDVVLASQSLEHWHQFKTRFRRGFREIHRVLKPGGTLIMNFPIHLHGHPIFVRGEITKVKALWSPRLWDDVDFEEWRRQYSPLDAYEGWLANSVDERLIPTGASSWTMNVVATKAQGKRLPTTEDATALLIDLDTWLIVPTRRWLFRKIWRIGRRIPGLRYLWRRVSLRRPPTSTRGPRL